MPRYKTIYEQRPVEYDLLVSREDYLGNILQFLKAIRILTNLEVAEFGAGTGRLTCLLAPLVKQIHAFDLYTPMRDKGNANLEKLNIKNAIISKAENKSLPLKDHSVDMSIAGWTFGHCTSWFHSTWKEEIGGAVQEMLRVTKQKDGTAIIFETLGTGQEEPNPPNQSLAEYYNYLENEFGFTRTYIRTDYAFKSLQEAQELTSTFFECDYEFKINSSGLITLPECTGIWTRHL